jgi:hypothetical protein
MPWPRRRAPQAPGRQDHPDLRRRRTRWQPGSRRRGGGVIKPARTLRYTPIRDPRAKTFVSVVYRHPVQIGEFFSGSLGAGAVTQPELWTSAMGRPMSPSLASSDAKLRPRTMASAPSGQPAVAIAPGRLTLWPLAQGGLRTLRGCPCRPGITPSCDQVPGDRCASWSIVPIAAFAVLTRHRLLLI